MQQTERARLRAAILGAFRDVANAHPEWRWPENLPVSVAKRAIGTVAGQAKVGGAEPSLEPARASSTRAGKGRGGAKTPRPTFRQAAGILHYQFLRAKRRGREEHAELIRLAAIAVRNARKRAE